MQHSTRDHDHDHDHVGHGHGHVPATHTRAFGIGIALNIAFVVIEGIVGWRIDSLALLADAGHNLSDVAGLVLAWVATIAAQRQPDQRHTYGWQRASILAAFVNSIVLLVAMGSLLWEAAHRLQSATATDGATMMLVATVGVVINGITALLFMQGGKSDINIRGAYLHMAADALVSLGVVVAGGLYLWLGWAWLDAATSIAIAIVIVLGSTGLFRQSLHLLFDGVPDQIDLPTVNAWLNQPGVADVHDLHVWAMSTTDIALTVHLVMPAGHPGDAYLHELARGLQEQFNINHPTMQVELVRLDHGCAHPQ